MDSRTTLKALRNRQDHHCFACGPQNPHGLKMTFYTDDKSVFSWVRVPGHLRGWDNLVHGGVISAILDEIMSWAAIYLIKKITLTKSMTVDFMKPVHVDSELRAEGRVLEQAGREAQMEGALYNHKGGLCARSSGLFVMLEPRIARRLGVLGDAAIRDFEGIIAQ
jgi:uncharacterized protein (TIGR00369 family)